jgi:glycosyltransferase involved in cell wall biosynthesis
MNSLFLVYSHYSRDARVRRYAESLARNGYKVDVVCLNEEYCPKEKNISLLRYPLGRRRYGKLWYILEYLLFFLYCTFILSINHLIKRYKVIHINNMPDFLVFAAAVPKFFGAKIILDLHDPMPELYMSKYHAGMNSQMVKWLKWLEKISVNFADCVITANPAFKDLFLSRNKIAKNKMKVILNCPDDKIFKLQKSKKSDNKYFDIIYMGTVEERFGLDVAIDGFPVLVKSIPNIRFVMIPKLPDEGKYFVELKNKIRKLKLEKYILFKSPTPLEELVREINIADVGIVLAKDGIFTDSIIPVKLLEFIKMEIPVIATKTKILSHLFSSRQIYFLKANTKEEFIQAVVKLWKDRSLRESLVKKAKEYLEKNNWKNEEKKYHLIIYESYGSIK